MNLNKKIVTAAVTGTLLLTVFTPSAFADDEKSYMRDHENKNQYEKSYDKDRFDHEYNAHARHGNYASAWNGESKDRSYEKENKQYNAVDREYMQMIIPHHREAIAMTEEELSRGSHSEVKAMAEKIRMEQRMGLEKAENLYREVFGEEPPAGMTMSALPELKNSAEIDKAFLALMTKHHSDGIVMAHKEINEGENHKVKQFANEDIPMQAKDIEEMAMLLHKLFK
jgi:uncharacterized protein (DUF305 family)